MVPLRTYSARQCSSEVLAFPSRVNEKKKKKKHMERIHDLKVWMQGEKLERLPLRHLHYRLEQPTKNVSNNRASTQYNAQHSHMLAEEGTDLVLPDWKLDQNKVNSKTRLTLIRG